MRSFGSVAFTVGSLLIILGCSKKEEDDPCARQVLPSISLNSWPVGLDVNAVDTVQGPHVIINLFLGAASDGTAGLHLTGGELRLSASGSDSVMYTTHLPLSGYFFSYNTPAVIQHITSPMPAELRVTVTNSCGNSSELHRSLLILPD